MNLLFQLYLFCECDVNDVDRELPQDLDLILNSVREASGICGENESGNGNESGVSSNTSLKEYSSRPKTVSWKIFWR